MYDTSVLQSSNWLALSIYILIISSLSSLAIKHAYTYRVPNGEYTRETVYYYWLCIVTNMTTISQVVQ